jgi:hypothetical protein
MNDVSYELEALMHAQEQRFGAVLSLEKVALTLMFTTYSALNPMLQMADSSSKDLAAIFGP